MKKSPKPKIAGTIVLLVLITLIFIPALALLAKDSNYLSDKVKNIEGFSLKFMTGFLGIFILFAANNKLGIPASDYYPEFFKEVYESSETVGTKATITFGMICFIILVICFIVFFINMFIIAVRQFSSQKVMQIIIGVLLLLVSLSASAILALYICAVPVWMNGWFNNDKTLNFMGYAPVVIVSLMAAVLILGILALVFPAQKPKEEQKAMD
ncbi:hypothetical protein [Mycoplasmopsis adleri]|uniref:hypothetical protein n=1 Tax=Mycoplasmopsis adleri TaxID=51362 RepID=UPI0038734913